MKNAEYLLKSLRKSIEANGDDWEQIVDGLTEHEGAPDDQEWDRIREVVKENARPKIILGGEIEFSLEGDGRNITNEEAIRLQEFLRDHSYGLMMAKRKDYSGDDDPFRNLRSSEVHGVEPWRGTMVRLQDKLARIRSVMEADGVMEVDESLIDTFADIHNYTDIIAGLVWEVLGLEIP